MFCPHCGSVNNDECVRCRICGKPLHTAALPAQSAPSAPVSAPSRSSLPLIIIAAVFGVAVFAVATVAIVKMVGDKQPEKVADTQEYTVSAYEETPPADESEVEAYEDDYGADSAPEETEPPAAQKEREDTTAAPAVSSDAPFYGVWCSAFKSPDKAQKAVNQLYAQGYTEARYVDTTDWRNMNSERWYAVTAGAYATKAEAEAALKQVRARYPDAYIKYTGARRS